MSGHCLRTSAVLKRVDEVIGDDLSSADAVIVGSPVYVGNMSGQVKTFFDNWGPKFGLGTGTGKMRNKVGAAFATALQAPTVRRSRSLPSSGLCSAPR